MTELDNATDEIIGQFSSRIDSITNIEGLLKAPTAVEPLPKDPFSIAPKRLQSAKNRLIYSMPMLAETSGYKLLSNLVHVWLWGELNADDDNSFFKRRETQYYQLPFQSFLVDEQFKQGIFSAQKQALLNLQKINESGSRVYKRLRDSIVELQKEPLGARKTITRGPTQDDVVKFQNRNSQNNYNLPTDLLHAGLCDLSTLGQLVGSHFNITQTIAALGSVKLSVFPELEITKETDKEFSLREINSYAIFKDKFLFEDTYQFLGLWDENTGLMERSEALLLLLATLALPAQFSRQALYKLLVENMLTNQDFRNFKDQFKPAYNKILDSNRYISNSAKRLKCEPFEVISTVYKLDQPIVAAPIKGFFR